jgi:hypothetical protein
VLRRSGRLIRGVLRWETSGCGGGMRRRRGRSELGYCGGGGGVIVVWVLGVGYVG